MSGTFSEAKTMPTMNGCAGSPQPHGTRLSFLKLGFRFSTKAVSPNVGFFAHVVEQGCIAGEVEEAHLAVAVGIEGDFEATEGGVLCWRNLCLPRRKIVYPPLSIAKLRHSQE
jgi:hypothetical protein